MARHTPVHWFGRAVLIGAISAFLVGWTRFLSHWLQAEGYVSQKPLLLAIVAGVVLILAAFFFGPARRRRLEHHVWFAFLVLAAAIVAESVVSILGHRFSWDVPLLRYLIVSSALWLLLFWLLFLSGYSLKTRIGYLVAFLASVGIAALLLRFSRWDDFGKPVFQWRWSSRNQASPPRDADATSATFKRAELVPTDHDFPQFLGANRDGILADSGVDWDWAARPPRELWRRRVGTGFGGFSVVNDYAITLEQRGASECTVCYEARTGNPVWVHAEPAHFKSDEGGEGPRSNPTIVNGKVYVQGATGLLLCLDGATGDVHWRVDLVQEHKVPVAIYGFAGSPLVTEDRVIVHAGGPGCSLLAFDRESGAKAWQASDEAAGYASPIQANLHGVSQVIYVHADGVAGNDLETGKRLWNYLISNGPKINCTQPVVLDPDRGDLYVVNGYGAGRSARIHAEPAGNDGWKVTEIWTSRGLKSDFSNVVRHGDYIYGLDGGILVCLDLATGDRKWKHGRHGKGQLLLVGTHLVVQEGNGGVALVAANPKRYELLATMATVEEISWNSPALAGNLLLIRTRDLAICYELPTTH